MSRYRALRSFYYTDANGKEHLAYEGKLLVQNTPDGKVEELLNDGLVEEVSDEEPKKEDSK